MARSLNLIIFIASGVVSGFISSYFLYERKSNDKADIREEFMQQIEFRRAVLREAAFEARSGIRNVETLLQKADSESQDSTVYRLRMSYTAHLACEKASDILEQLARRDSILFENALIIK